MVLLVISLLNVGCDKDFSDDIQYNQPVAQEDGLNTGSLEEVHIDTQMILNAQGRIQNGKYGEVHSMLIYRGDKLAFEEYFKGHKFQWDAPHYYGKEVQWDMDMLHSMMSCTKSFMSACIGIAIDRGFIEDVQQSIFDYLPDYQDLKTNNREYITIEHLLTMSSGLAWDEWGAAHGTSANDVDMLYFDCDDPLICVLERPWWAVPGQFFTYNGGGMVILGEILKNASGLNMDEFSKIYLFEPLGIKSSGWTRYKNGMFDTAGSLMLTSRAMMKFGVSYLNKGLWKDERILPPEWIKKSSEIYNNNTNLKVPLEGSTKSGYGYTWWINEFSYKDSTIKMYRASGWGDQSIMVFPELDMVLVFTGANYEDKSSLFEIVERFVLPAVL